MSQDSAAALSLLSLSMAASEVQPIPLDPAAAASANGNASANANGKHPHHRRMSSTGRRRRLSDARDAATRPLSVGSPGLSMAGLSLSTSATSASPTSALPHSASAMSHHAQMGVPASAPAKSGSTPMPIPAANGSAGSGGTSGKKKRGVDHQCEACSKLLQCCKTIIARPEAAISVWKLEINCFPSCALKNFYITFRSAMAKMGNLQAISMGSPDLFHSISDMVFPRLIDCTIPLLLDSYSFLSRNPTIESAAVVALDQGNGSLFKLFNDFSSIQPIHMPKLQHFDGPEIAACTVVPGSPVSRLMIRWDRNPAMEFSRGLTAAASSEAELRELMNIIHFWDPVLLKAIVKHTPRIQFLVIKSSTFTGLTPEKEDFLSAMDNILPFLTSLAKLLVSDDTPSRLDRIGDKLESQFDRVRRWGDGCPTLTHIGVPTPWRRVGRVVNVWAPVKCFTDDPKLEECLRWFIKKVAISPQLSAGYRRLARHFAGVDGMQVLNDAVKRGEVMPDFEILRKDGGGTVISFPSDA
ncbi:hypothetical protein MSAN_00217400 [Mycena sanguinolenta]|uniref:Uncharacterized protein n=1 Tax=Mycena sanguinolenta TaxID=230812 RepID=A0A8H7DKX1_9AGAR|nr:hypothetical protein MSAN_00217400 [Mycena sanguinolenta]